MTVMLYEVRVTPSVPYHVHLLRATANIFTYYLTTITDMTCLKPVFECVCILEQITVYSTTWTKSSILSFLVFFQYLLCYGSM